MSCCLVTTPEMRQVARRCVKRGGRFLDRIRPEWPRLTPASLNVNDPNNCPLSHATGQAYFDVVKDLDLEEPDLDIKFGFTSNECNPRQTQVSMGLLTFYWRIERMRRLKAARKQGRFAHR